MTSAHRSEPGRGDGQRGWWSRLFHREPEPPVIRLGISALDPEAEVRAWRSIGDRMLELEQSMTTTVHELRDDLAEANGSAARYRPPFHGSSLPSHSADVIGEAVALEDSVTNLYEHLDSLWFERQWLSAQLAVAKGEFRLTPSEQR